MKITDPDIIKTGERDLIDAIKEDLDMDAVKEILKRQIAKTVLSAKGGQIIVHNNQIAFQMDFDLNLSGTLLFDRDGNHIPVSEADPPPGDEADTEEDMELEDISLDKASDDYGPELENQEDSELPGPDEEDLSQADNELTQDELDVNLDADDLNLEENVIIDENLDDDILEDLDDISIDEEALSDLSTQGDMDDILQESRDFWEQTKDS